MGFDSTTEAAVAALGVSATTLRRLRQAGVLRPGRDFAAHGLGTKRPNLRWSVEQVQKTLADRSRRVLR
jgi:hypothetical protein